MKRALAVLLAFVGFSAFAMFKGSWSASFCLPALTVSTDLVITYSVAGFDITSTSRFTQAGYVSQSFGLKGAFGPFSLTGGMVFNPVAPAYLRSFATTGFDFGGVGISLLVRHWLPGGWDPAWTDDPCLPQSPYAAGMQYTLTTTVAPVSLRVRFLDCCGGIEFQDLRVTLTGIDLCCGIKYNALLDITKTDGFSLLRLDVIDAIKLCCGISFDLRIDFGVDSKSVSLTPKIAGIGDACFTVWARPSYAAYVWEGIRIDGFRIRCTIGECNYLEIVEVFDFTGASAVPSAIRGLFNRAAGCGEYQYIGLGFCGPGCCGGRYTVDLRIFFGTGGTLFDITKFTGSAKIPIMPGFTLDLSASVPTVGACGAVSYCLGWSFTF